MDVLTVYLFFLETFQSIKPCRYFSEIMFASGYFTICVIASEIPLERVCYQILLLSCIVKIPLSLVSDRPLTQGDCLLHASLSPCVLLLKIPWIRGLVHRSSKNARFEIKFGKIIERGKLNHIKLN